MREQHVRLPDGRAVQLRTTSRADGDLAIDGPAPELAARRSAIVHRPWVWVRQVHGARVVVVADDDDPGAVAGTEADGLVTARDDVALAVHGADCGIVGLWSPEGVVGAAHAGWKGLEAGVLDAVVDAMARQGASSVAAHLGPCIGPECYEFGTGDLERLERALGRAVRGTTSWGAPALDLPTALAAALARAGVETVGAPAACTACAADDHWSHRARRDAGRQALVVWLEPPPEASDGAGAGADDADRHPRGPT